MTIQQNGTRDVRMALDTTMNLLNAENGLKSTQLTINQDKYVWSTPIGMAEGL